jgi:nitrite reductase (NADH) small subunit
LDSGTFRTVARVGEIVEGRGEPFEVDGRAIAVFLDEGTYYAIDDACPHKGVPLCDGILHEETVICTWHGWCFRLADGQRLDAPGWRIGTYSVRVVGDEIQVSVA